MGIVKSLRLSFMIVGGASLLIAGGLYVQASCIPPTYRPVQLSAQQRKRVVKEFWARVQEFGNASQGSEPFAWTITQDQFNEYLASMDEIASVTPSGKPGAIYRAMETAQVAEPVVVLQEDLLTFMVRSKARNKVFSADLSFSFTSDEQLRVRLVEVRAGRLSLPNSWVRSRLEEAKRLVRTDRKTARHSVGKLGEMRLVGLSPEDIASAVAAVISAINEEPISAELTWPVNKKDIRIERIDIGDGLLRLQVVPTGRKESRD